MQTKGSVYSLNIYDKDTRKETPCMFIHRKENVLMALYRFRVLCALKMQTNKKPVEINHNHATNICELRNYALFHCFHMVINSCDRKTLVLESDHAVFLQRYTFYSTNEICLHTCMVLRDEVQRSHKEAI